MRKLRCKYQRTIFRNEKDGYTIFAVKTKEDVPKDKLGKVVCDGYFPLFPVNIGLILNGDFIKSKRGMKFHAESYRLELEGEAEAVSFLSSHVFDEIGPKIAERIIQEIGSDVFAYAAKADAATVLSKKIKGLSDRVAIKLIGKIREMSCMQEMIRYMLSIGGGYINAEKICEKFGESSFDVINENPYQLLIADIPYEQCDAIAREKGIEAYDPIRVKALVYTAMLQNESSGNTRISFHELCRLCKNLERRANMGYSLHPLFIAAQIQKESRYVVKTEEDNVYIYRKRTYEQEKTIAREISRIHQTAIHYEEEIYPVAEIEKDTGIKYDVKQAEALHMTESSGIKILTGGPGTGKTTTINGFIQKYIKEHPGHVVRLCAPTGCAVRHMEDSTSMSAETIHRMLDIRPYDGIQVKRDEYNRIDADCVIVDEASMIDTEMFSLLLKALKNGVLLLLVGDKDQLPSVGPGNILRDLIASGAIETCALESIFRQKEGGTIIANSYRIKNGDANLETGKDFEIYHYATAEELAEAANEKMKTLYDIAHPENLRVFTPVRKRDYNVGSINMNINMKKYLLEQNIIDKKNTLYYGAYQYNVGDVVVMTKNNRKQGYYNGDEGIVTKIQAGDKHRFLEVNVHGRYIRLSGQDLGDIELAYAMTAHKSQGGECETSIIVVPKEPRSMLDRSIIYVEATRAKKKNIMLIEDDALKIALSDKMQRQRCTGLLERMRETARKNEEIPAGNTAEKTEIKEKNHAEKSKD